MLHEISNGERMEKIRKDLAVLRERLGDDYLEGNVVKNQNNSVKKHQLLCGLPVGGIRKTCWGRSRAHKDDMRRRDIADARWGRGPLAGKTGNPLIDDPFFNPWAPGGTFNK